MSVIDHAVQDVTMVIRHDVFTAPAASRIYAYTTYAGYLAMHQENEIPLLIHATSQLPTGGLDNDTVGALAMYLTAQAFIYSDSMLIDKCHARLGDIDPMDTIYRTAARIATAVIDWSTGDNYATAISMPRYTLKPHNYAWRPTPPDYAAGTDPNWGRLTPFQFRFDSSTIVIPDFYGDTTILWYEAQRMYGLTRAYDSIEIATALFWDDNPFIIRQSGHFTVAEKKVSPPGHWLDITREAIRLSGMRGKDATRAYALVSIAMADAMIAVWDIKYQVQLIRPETYVNTYIDADWRPFLQTPPFPEYPSGHSAVSAAAATILTSLFGNDMSFTDASETVYGLPAREFKSFAEAASEASISRVLGGIHFNSGVEAGALIGTASAKALLKTSTVNGVFNE